MALRGRRAAHPQEGYILLALALAMALLLIALSAELPKLSQQIKREREQELVHRGQQYARAVKRFYRKFGRYPNSIENLENTNNLRFLRQRYKDPMTGKDEWRLIRFGEAKASTRGMVGRQGQPGQAQPQQPKIGTAAAEISRPAGSGKQLGGGPIVGVSSTSEETGIKEFDGKTKYKEWEFVWDPSMEQGAAGQPGGMGQPAGGERPGGVGQPGHIGQPAGGMGSPGPGTPPAGIPPGQTGPK